MFYMIIVIIGIFEFILGSIIAIFSKSQKICKYTSLLYSEKRENEKEFQENINKINKLIGENSALGGSLYAFFGAITRYYDISTIILILIIGIVELYTYKRLTKGINYIMTN